MAVNFSIYAQMWLNFMKKMDTLDKRLNTSEESFPRRRRKIANVVQLIAFSIIVCTILAASVYTFQACNPTRFYKGFDSWGNVCGGDSATVSPITNLDGSGQLKSESGYVWQMNLLHFSLGTLLSSQNPEKCTSTAATLDENMAVNLCTNVCPNASAIRVNTTSYRGILKDNGYQRSYVAAYKVVSLLEKIITSCVVAENASDPSFVHILGRCVPGSLLRNGYRLIPNYLSIWHYAANDVIICSIAMTGSLMVMLAASVIVSVATIRWPQQATIGCFLVSSVVSLSCGTFNVWKVYRNVDPNNQASVTVVNDRRFLSLLCLTASVMVSITAFQKWWKYRRYVHSAGGLMSETSKCLKSLPKLLSEPLWTLFALSLCSFYFAFVCLYALNCHHLQASSEQVVEYVTPETTFSEVTASIAIIAVFIWYLGMLKSGQQAVIAGAVAHWFFTKRKNKLLHPITRSLRSTLQHNIGSVVACAFNSSLLHCLLSLCCKTKGSKRNSIVSPESDDANFVDLSSWRSCFSPYAPTSIGVYGYLRETCLCDANDDVACNRKCTIFEQFSNHGSRSHLALRLDEEGLAHVLQFSALVTRWCIRSVICSLICLTLSTFLAITINTQTYLLLFPFLINLFIAYHVSDTGMNVLTTTLDTIAVCVFEDLTRNNGVTMPYYASRRLLHSITGIRLPETATFTSIHRRERRKRLLDAQVIKEQEHRLKEEEALERIRRRSLKSRIQNLQDDTSTETQHKTRQLLPASKKRGFKSVRGRGAGSTLAAQTTKRTQSSNDAATNRPKVTPPKKTIVTRDLPSTQRGRGRVRSIGVSQKKPEKSVENTQSRVTQKENDAAEVHEKGNWWTKTFSFGFRKNLESKPTEKYSKPVRVIKTVRHHDDESETDSDAANDEQYAAKIWRYSFW